MTYNRDDDKYFPNLITFSCKFIDIVLRVTKLWFHVTTVPIYSTEIRILTSTASYLIVVDKKTSFDKIL